jgi:hypothetical protein
MVTRETWETEIQQFEAGWWGDCANTYGEETKQIAYARVMGLDPGKWSGGIPWPTWDFSGKRVLDVGGGPSSMLLKSTFEQATVVDPCMYPRWVYVRYDAHHVSYFKEPAEDYLKDCEPVDVALMYNVLQHTIDPELIVRQLRRAAKRIHVFEWVDMAPSPGHPHEFSVETFREWFEAEGTSVWFDDQYKQVANTASSAIQHGWGGAFDGSEG